MTRLRRLAARIRHAVAAADVLAAGGIAAIAFGAWLAWPPAGFMFLGLALLVVARTGTEA